VTRVISLNILRGSGTKFKTNPETAASNVSFSDVSFAASPLSNVTRESAMLCRAVAIKPSALSVPAIDHGSHRARMH
jgi:hypothetical protein